MAIGRFAATSVVNLWIPIDIRPVCGLQPDIVGWFVNSHCLFCDVTEEHNPHDTLRRTRNTVLDAVYNSSVSVPELWRHVGHNPSLGCKIGFDLLTLDSRVAQVTPDTSMWQIATPAKASLFHAIQVLIIKSAIDNRIVLRYRDTYIGEDSAHSLLDDVLTGLGRLTMHDDAHHSDLNSAPGLA
jgi:hypothetical protein